MLDIRTLTVAYGEHIALSDLSLKVKPGEILAVIGPNGAGKSTLVRAISGLVAPASGEIRFNDRPSSRLDGPMRARQAAVVPQGGYLPKAFTVYQTIMLGRTPYLGWLGRPQPTDQAAVQQAMHETDLLELQHRVVGELSGGEQQRVLLARAIAQDTPALLLDEPTTHLDLRHQAGILKLVRQLATDKQLAVLMVVHDLNHAAMFADRVALLVRGKLAAEGPPCDVLTSERLSDVYGLGVHITQHPETGAPIVLLQA